MEYIAGVDAGGTKTSILCMDREGQIIDSKKFGPFNLNSIGEEKFKELLVEIGDYLNDLGDCKALCIGAAGVSNQKMRDLVETELKNKGILNYKLVGDEEIALWGALDGKPGISVVAGTGSVCCGKNLKSEFITVGGWGHLLGDEGSGYAIGRDAIKAVIAIMDGYGEKTRLEYAVKEKFDLDSRRKIIEYVYNNNKSSVAAIAKTVLDEAQNGDKVSIEILQRNAKELCRQIGALKEKLSLKECEVALLGGLLENDTLYRKYLVDEINNISGLSCVTPKQSALMGACMMALGDYKNGIK